MTPFPAGIVASARVASTGGGPIVSDSFTRADGAVGNAPTGQTWVATGSGMTWAIASNKVYRTGGSDPGGVAPLIVNAGITAMKTTVTPTSYFFTNLWVRTDATGTNGYRIEWRNDNGTVYVGRMGGPGGYIGTSGTGVLSASGPVTVRVSDPDASTVRIEFIQGGVVKYTADDTSGSRLTTGTYSGFSSYDTSFGFDDFTVEAA